MDAHGKRFEQLVHAITDTLGESLVGLILYGSAVSGGLRPDSDIDLLAVTDRPLGDAQRDALVEVLLDLSGRRARRGPWRPVELTVITAAETTVTPPTVELQYGEWLRDDAVAGRLAGRHVDPDAVLLLAMARQEGRAVTGLAPERILPVIPAAAVRAAVVETLPTLLDDLEGDERNVVLTLARMLVTLREARFVPKDAAAERVSTTVTEEQGAMLRLAAAAYRGEVDDDWDALRVPMHAFVTDAAAEIGAAASRSAE